MTVSAQMYLCCIHPTSLLWVSCNSSVTLFQHYASCPVCNTRPVKLSPVSVLYDSWMCGKWCVWFITVVILSSEVTHNVCIHEKQILWITFHSQAHIFSSVSSFLISVFPIQSALFHWRHRKIISHFLQLFVWNRSVQVCALRHEVLCLIWFCDRIFRNIFLKRGRGGIFLT